jgi:hypothetical protein
MSEKTIESSGKGFLVLLLPISFLIVFLISTWRILLAIALLVIGLNVWQRYQWQNWCQEVNPMFSLMIREGQGRITPMDLAIRGNFSGTTAKRYLDTKASEFGANILSEDNGEVYYFLTSVTLGSMLDSSEPLKELPDQQVARFAPALLVAPPPLEQAEVLQVTTEEHLLQEVATDSVIPPQHQETTIPLEEQFLFGSLIQSELAKRLSVYSSTVFKRRDDPDFPEWTRSRDPDGIAWKYSRKTREFFPLEEGEEG